MSATLPSESSRATFAILNRQRLRRVDTRLLRRVVRALLHDLAQCRDYELAIHLVGAVEMARVNERFLRHTGSTDVITFEHPGSRPAALRGELFICLADAIAQARVFRTSWQSELVRYIAHGILHLRGFDDHSATGRRRMKREENRLVRELSRRFPFAALARPTATS